MAPRKRVRWSILVQFCAAVCIALLTSVLVILLLKKSLWSELEIIVGVLSFFYLIYAFLIFYKGVRLNKKEKYTFQWISQPEILSQAYLPVGIDTTDFGFTSALSSEGPLGCLLGLILDVFVSFVIVLAIAALLWLGMNVLLTAIVALCLPLFYLFRRSLRVAIARGRACHKKAGKSIMQATITTVTNMGWLYLVIFVGHHCYNWLKIN